MNKHTTSFTTNPVPRARERVRQAVQTLMEDARLTGDAFAQFQNDREVEYQRAVQAQCRDLLGHIDRKWNPAPPAPASLFDRRSTAPQTGTELGSHG